MNENIDLTKILKYCPKGYKLYTPLYGEVEFEGIIYGKFPIVVTDEFRNIYFTEKGLYYDAPNAECLLFPSKEQRDWSKFTAPWLEKQGKPNPYSGVSFKYNGHTWGMCARDNGVEILVDGEIKERIFLDNKPRGKSALEALKEEKVDNANKVEPKFKVGDRVRHKETNKDDVYEISKVYDDSYGIAGFTWMIYMKYQDQYELVPNKFDPKTLKPFDKVLVKSLSSDIWKCGLFSHIEDDRTPYKYSCAGSSYETCIPYNDDTKYLVGTTDEAPEYYRYWED